MSKRDVLWLGGALELLETLFYDVFGPWMARVYRDEFVSARARRTDAAASRRAPTAEGAGASSEVTMSKRAMAGAVGRRPRTA